jgi:predicted lipid-binding transport protein (Tim44 family)
MAALQLAMRLGYSSRLSIELAASYMRRMLVGGGTMSWRCGLIGLVAMLIVIGISASAEARIGGGRSFGYRGERTYAPPPVTQTAPRAASPIERPYQQTQSQPVLPRNSGGMFGGFGRGLVGGLIGAGLFGLLFGHGLFEGVGSLSSFIGLLLQIGLVVLLVRLAMQWFAHRQLVVGGAGGAPPSPSYRAPVGPPASPTSQPLRLQPGDFDRFERLLGEIQTAYGREDAASLRQLVTPTMMDSLAGDLEANRRQGLVNRISAVTLLQGDLAEAWHEATGDYATLAMRYGLIDVMADRQSGRLTSGDPNQPQEVTELWTFQRAPGKADWLLSAIQQT